MEYYDQVKEAADLIRAAVAGRFPTHRRWCSARASAISRARWPNAVVDALRLVAALARIARHRPRRPAGGRHLAQQDDCRAGRALSTSTKGTTSRPSPLPFACSGLLGVKTLILTNAAGGVNTSFLQGALMVIDDHINLMGNNPLVGLNDDRFGPRFPDMTEVYFVPPARESPTSAAAAMGAEAAARRLRRSARAQLRDARLRSDICARLVSTRSGCPRCPRRIVARHMGMKVLGISCITNMAAGVLPQPLNHDEVDGNGAARSGSVHRAPGGSHWPALTRWWNTHVAPASTPSRTIRTSRSARRCETADGTIVTGCNVENATYGLTVCAERVAMFKALSEGHRSFTRVAVVADTADRRRHRAARAARFCGSSAATSEVVLANLTEIKGHHRPQDLLPLPFDARLLTRSSKSSRSTE